MLDRLAAIGLGDVNYARLFREESGISFPLLIDEDRRVYSAAGLRSASLLHVFRSDNAAARKRARAAGHRQHRLGQNPFQLGASFVFGPGNVDRYVHLSKTFGDNAQISDLLTALPLNSLGAASRARIRPRYIESTVLPMETSATWSTPTT